MITTLRIDDALKKECDSVLDDIGLNFSCAINVFLKELTRRRAMPFALRAGKAQEQTWTMDEIETAFGETRRQADAAGVAPDAIETAISEVRANRRKRRACK